MIDKNFCDFVQILFLVLSVLEVAESKVYKPCDLAQELIEKYRFAKTDITNWICLIRRESNFDTAAVGKLNQDGSFDHGLFQISDKFWCAREKVDGACGLKCSQLEDDDIRDDAICARRIFRITKEKTGNGFDAWAGWKQHCQNEDLRNYLNNCTLSK